MAQTTEAIILEEVRGLRKDFGRFALDTEGRLSALEAHDHQLMGNGQPGVIAKLEEAIGVLMAWRWWILGACAGISSCVSVAAWLVVRVTEKSH